MSPENMKLARGTQHSEVSVVKRWLSELREGERGLVLPIVLAMLVLGSLLIVPSLNYAATSLKAGEMVEENAEGLYAADAGVEDALWKLLNDKPASFPHSYQLTDVNGLTVDVIVDEITTLFGEETEPMGDHSDWMILTKTVTYNAGIYDYTLSITNDGDGNIKIEKILFDFQASLDYEGPTAGDITTDDPAVNGNPTVGITLTWDIPIPHPTIGKGETANHNFLLSGPPDVQGVEGHGYVQASREDIGTVWDGDYHPFTITAEAKDANNAVVASIRAGVWQSTDIYVTCWQVNQ